MLPVAYTNSKTEHPKAVLRLMYNSANVPSIGADAAPRGSMPQLIPYFVFVNQHWQGVHVINSRSRRALHSPSVARKLWHVARVPSVPISAPSNNTSRQASSAAKMPERRIKPPSAALVSFTGDNDQRHRGGNPQWWRHLWRGYSMR